MISKRTRWWKKDGREKAVENHFWHFWQYGFYLDTRCVTYYENICIVDPSQQCCSCIIIIFFLEKKNLNHLKYIFIQFQSRWFYPLEAHQQIPPHRKGLVRSSNDDTREHNTSMKKKKKKTGNKGKVHCLLHCQVIHYYTCTCPLPVAPRHLVARH